MGSTLFLTLRHGSGQAPSINSGQEINPSINSGQVEPRSTAELTTGQVKLWKLNLREHFC